MNEYNGNVNAPISTHKGFVSGDDLAVWADGTLPRMSVQGETTLWKKVSA